MEKIAHRTGENKGAAPYPSLSGPPALQRKRDRTGEILDEPQPAPAFPPIPETPAAARLAYWQVYAVAVQFSEHADYIRRAVEAGLNDAATLRREGVL